MNKRKKYIVTVLLTSLILTLAVSLANRKIYGTWNVFSYPNRVFFGCYRYDSNGYIVTLNGKEKPIYEVSSTIDKITGKRIYSKDLNYIGDGKVVYLHLDGDRYLVLGSGGGG